MPERGTLRLVDNATEDGENVFIFDVGREENNLILLKEMDRVTTTEAEEIVEEELGRASSRRNLSQNYAKARFGSEGGTEWRIER